jgi:hypothetical protein
MVLLAVLALNCAEALAQLISHIVPHFIIGMALVAGVGEIVIWLRSPYLTYSNLVY